MSRNGSKDENHLADVALEEAEKIAKAAREASDRFFCKSVVYTLYKDPDGQTVIVSTPGCMNGDQRTQIYATLGKEGYSEDNIFITGPSGLGEKYPYTPNRKVVKSAKRLEIPAATSY